MKAIQSTLCDGTAHTLHLVGYTLAGKTGTAQIYDFARRAYSHKYNASFMGFAPVNNPSFLMVVTVGTGVSSTTMGGILGRAVVSSIRGAYGSLRYAALTLLLERVNLRDRILEDMECSDCLFKTKDGVVHGAVEVSVFS